MLGFGGPRNPLSQVSAPAGVGVKGVVGSTASSASDAHPKTACSASILYLRPTRILLVTGCSASAIPSVEQASLANRNIELALGGTAPRIMGSSGLATLRDKSGVFGFNTKQQGTGYGVFGRCDASNGAGVEAESGHGVGVRGHSRLNDAIVGLSDANSKSGVYGFNSSPKGVAYGVFGRADSAGGAGVAGASENGYGGSFRGGQAPMRLQPRTARARPPQAIA